MASIHAERDAFMREARLVTRPEMQSLLPDGKMHVERWSGMPKSLIAMRSDRTPGEDDR